MINDKSHVSMEQHVCPACARTHDVGILLNTRLGKTLERTTVTGWRFCKECQSKLDDGYCILVAVDLEKSVGAGASEVYRTGGIAYIKDSDAPPLQWITQEDFDDLT